MKSHLLAIYFFPLAACAASIEPVVSAFVTYAELSEEMAIESYKIQIRECQTKPDPLTCEAEVDRKFEALIAADEELRKAWCQVAPKTERCGK